MAVVSIISVLVFSAVTCYVEIPKMVQSKSIKELWVFSLLFALGITLAILKSLKVTLPSPSVGLAWLYSPVSDILKDFWK